MFSSMLSALPVAMVTTTGARSGQPRTVPLLAHADRRRDGDHRLQYGNAKHPAWRHNLRKHPDGEIEVEGERWAFRAVEVEDERRERIWQKALRDLPRLRRLRQARRPAAHLGLRPPSGLGPLPDAVVACAAYG